VPPTLVLLPPALLTHRGSCTRPSCAQFRLARPATGALLAHLIAIAAAQEVHTEPAHPAVGLARVALADGAQEARRSRHRAAPPSFRYHNSVIMPCDLDPSSGSDSLFAPYLPHAAHYERGLVVPSSYSFTCASPPLALLHPHPHPCPRPNRLPIRLLVRLRVVAHTSALAHHLHIL
ncbi:hypothetical protein B0H14DRAFT_2954901, partial [Mycena olivaceomarginata]